MASISVQVTIENHTGLTLLFHDITMVHGIVNGAQPPANSIAPGGSTTFLTESSTTLTGVEGTVGYRADGIEPLFAMFFDNPFIGGNTYDSAPPPGYEIRNTGGGGNNSSVTFMIRPR